MLFNLPIEATLQHLLKQEDTDGDKKITIEDNGPKVFPILSTTSKTYTVSGTYELSNLLQELVIQQQEGKTEAQIPLQYINEPPTNRISRMIKHYYWSGLTRRMDSSGIKALVSDTKNSSLTAKVLPVYVPFTDHVAFNYYKKLEANFPIKTIKLPQVITPSFVKTINTSPGILSLKLIKNQSGITAVPFVVPGGRFNEMYGWDSYFEAIGLLCDGKTDLAIAMADNFQYQIQHYGKILNANRSYYLTRTQPPFYSSLIREIFEITKDTSWLKSHLKTVIHEYETVWMTSNKRLTTTGLNRYFAEGLGIPPETEAGHFDEVLKPYAKQHQLSITAFTEAYQNGTIQVPELDVYFTHDRSLRESGHDTSWRLDNVCADLNTVALNSLLYKYETDIAFLIEHYCNANFNGQTASSWQHKAEQRKQLMDTLLWDTKQQQYFDYNFKTQQPTYFESATNYIPLWAGLVTPSRAKIMVKSLMQQLKVKGGIVGTSKVMHNALPKHAIQRQWDYPNGWAPHQMLIWRGLQHYDCHAELQELVYRWLFMITKNAVDYNGTIPEKYNVVEATHKVFAEYGNVGTSFEYITQEGFGWMNASYQLGLSLLTTNYKTKLNQLISPETLFKTL